MSLLLQIANKVLEKAIDLFADPDQCWGIESTPTLEEQAKETDKEILIHVRQYFFKEVPPENLTQHMRDIVQRHKGLIAALEMVRREGYDHADQLK